VGKPICAPSNIARRRKELVPRSVTGQSSMQQRDSGVRGVLFECCFPFILGRFLVKPGRWALLEAQESCSVHQQQKPEIPSSVFVVVPFQVGG
jgi:hypothetical protein